MVTNPLYNQINALKSGGASYDTALSTSKTLESERDQLVAKENAIDPNNLDRLQKLLPDNINSIRLILEIGQIASPYGMVLSNVKYDTSDTVLNEVQILNIVNTVQHQNPGPSNPSRLSG